MVVCSLSIQQSVITDRSNRMNHKIFHSSGRSPESELVYYILKVPGWGTELGPCDMSRQGFEKSIHARESHIHLSSRPQLHTFRNLELFLNKSLKEKNKGNTLLKLIHSGSESCFHFSAYFFFCMG